MHGEYFTAGGVADTDTIKAGECSIPDNEQICKDKNNAYKQQYSS